MMRRIDLLPPVYAERRRQRRQVGLVIVIVLAILGLQIFWWVLLDGQISDKEEELASVEAQNAEIQAQIGELQRFSELEAEVNAKQGALRTVMTGDVDWPALLTEIAMVVPSEVWLDNLVASAARTEGETPVGTETAEVRISEQLPAGRIQFTGNSLTMAGVAKWLVRLGSVKEFHAVWLNSATSLEEQGDAGGEVITFDSSLELSERATSGRFQQGATGE